MSLQPSAMIPLHCPAVGRTRWLMMTVAVLLAAVAINLVREKGAADRPRSASIEAEPRSVAPVLAGPPSSQSEIRSESMSTPVEPVRIRDAWDFVGPELHGTPEVTLSAAVPAEAVAAVAAAWRAGDYARAAALVATWPGRDDRRQMFPLLLWEWIETNPTAAAEFAQTLPPGVERREMLEVVVREWAERDIAAAGAWLAAQPPQADRDGAAAAIATNATFSERHPEVALAWATSIATPSLRWEAAATVAASWARQDAAAMTRYFEQSTAITGDERARLLAYVRQSTAAVP
jgi:hypothetical protein